MPYKDPELKKEKQAGYSRTYYSKNKDKSKVATKNTKIKERLKWYIFKATLKCTACGYSHIACLDFHHEDPSTKKGSVHQFISNGQFAKAYEEIKKCIVLCANCHRIHHHEERIKRKTST